jgi:hypothetical protein
MVSGNANRDGAHPRARRTLVGLGLTLAMTIASGVVFTSSASAVTDSSMGSAVGKAAYEQGVTSDSASVIARRTGRAGLCNYYTGWWFDNYNDMQSTAGGSNTSAAGCAHATSGYEYHNNAENWTSVKWVGRNWCADFAKYIFYWAGADTEHINGLASSFKTYGVAMGTFHYAGNYIPRRGDAVMYDWDLDGDIDHVGIVTSWYADNTDGTYGSVEGNRGGGNGEVVHKTDQDYNGAYVYGYTTPVA